MNEELQKALADVINKASSGIDTASEFIVAELPEAVQQALTWYMVESLIYFVIAALIVFLWIYCEKLAFNYFKDEDASADDWICSFVGVGSIPRLVFILTILWLGNLDWLKIWIAPKLWLIEYAAKLAG